MATCFNNSMENQRSIEQTLRRLEHRLVELSAWKNQISQTISGGQFRALGAKKAVAIEVGDFWSSRDFPVTLEFQTRVPKAWAGKPVAVRFQVGGEGKLSVNGRLIGGLNQFHIEHLILEKAKANEILHFGVLNLVFQAVLLFQ